MLFWLSGHSGTIQAVSTIIIALLTAFYVGYTRQLLANVRAETLNQKRPIIVFRFRHATGSGEVPVTQDRMVNVGSGPALHIALYSNLTFSENGGDVSFTDQLKPWPLPIDNILGPESGDPEMQICFNVGQGEGRTLLRGEGVKLSVKYEDIFGRKFATDFVRMKHTIKGPTVSGDVSRKLV